MMMAVGCIGLFVVFDIVITWAAHSVMIASGTQYVDAASDAARSTLVASAAFPSAILESPLAGFGAILVPSLGIFLAGIAMLRGVFGKTAVYLAMAAGVTAFAFMLTYVFETLPSLRVVNALIVTIWYLIVGIRLYGLSRGPRTASQ